MLAPALTGFCVFYVYVNFSSVLMSFSVVEKGRTVVGLSNYGRFFRELRAPGSQMLSGFLNTVATFFSGLLITYPVSLVICYFIFKRIAGYKFFRFVFYMPAIIMGTVSVVLFKYVIQRGGPLDWVFQNAFHAELPPFLTQSGWASGTVIFYAVFFSLGSNMLIFSGAMTGINTEVLEAAKLDGCGIARELIQIVIPLIWPTVSTMLLLVSVGLFTASGPVLLLTKGAFNSYTISYWIYERMLEGSNLEFAAATGIICTLAGFPVVLAVRYGLNKLGDKLS